MSHLSPQSPAYRPSRSHLAVMLLALAAHTTGVAAWEDAGHGRRLLRSGVSAQWLRKEAPRIFVCVQISSQYVFICLSICMHRTYVSVRLYPGVHRRVSSPSSEVGPIAD